MDRRGVYHWVLFNQVNVVCFEPCFQRLNYVFLLPDSVALDELDATREILGRDIPAVAPIQLPATVGGYVRVVR